jgi:multiple sugar transport system ATP-binding protein
VLEARLEERNGGLTAVAGSQEIALDEETLSRRPDLKSYAGRELILGIRPEDLEDAELAPDESTQRLRGQVTLTEALGAEIMVHFRVDAEPAITDDVRELAQDAGAEGLVERDSDEEGATMVGRFGARSRVRMGDTVDVAVDTRSLHFFEPESGLGIYDGTTSPSPMRTEAR